MTKKEAQTLRLIADEALWLLKEYAEDQGWVECDRKYGVRLFRPIDESPGETEPVSLGAALALEGI